MNRPWDYLVEMAGKSYEQRMRDHYGVTDNPYLGGYLLPDGSFLDFSEGSGSRTMDHRNVEQFPTKTWRKNRPNRYRWDSVEHLSKKVGMYRWVPESWHITMWTKPTREQLRTIKGLARMKPIMIAATHRGKKMENYDYTTHDVFQILDDIEKFFR